MTPSLVGETPSPVRGAPPQAGGAPSQAGGAPSQAGGAPSLISEAPSPARGAQLLTGGAPSSAGGAPSENAQLAGTVCFQGHSMTDLQNLFARPLCKQHVRDMNSDAHAMRKYGATGQQRTRSQCDNLRRKLTNVKRRRVETEQ